MIFQQVYFYIQLTFDPNEVINQLNDLISEHKYSVSIIIRFTISIFYLVFY